MGHPDHLTQIHLPAFAAAPLTIGNNQLFQAGQLCVTYVSASVSDPFTSSPDPTKNLNTDPDPDPRYYLKLPGINIKLFYNLKIFASTQSRKWMRQPAPGGWIKRSNCIYIFSSSSITFQHGMFRKLRSSEIPLKDIML